MRSLARDPADLEHESDGDERLEQWLRDAEASVELHVLNHEWYFTAASAKYISDLIQRKAEIVCLGTPTVAAQLARDGRAATLVESNHLNRIRFPDLSTSVRVIWGDVGRTPQIPLASAVVFDAPWYPSDVIRWLEIANRVCVVGGQIVFALFPQWIRSSAGSEREQVLELAATIGSLEVDRDRLVYKTPRFEAEALLAAGVPPAVSWRKADLVVLTKTKAIDHISTTPAPTPHDHWETYLVDTQVVKLRKRSTFHPTVELAPIPGCPGDVLPSVSQRDPRRRLVGIWTSRNRVASVANPKHVRRALVRLASSMRTEQPNKRAGRYIDGRLRELLGLG